MKKLVLSIISGLVLLSAVSTANAAGTYGGQNCQPVYGGGETCVTTTKILINKTVLNPQTKQYVDNLTVNDAKYMAGQTVTFQITVMNTGSETISEATIKDSFPSYIGAVSGPGTFDANSKTLTYKLSNLNPNQSVTTTVTGTLVTQDKLTIKGAQCLVNSAEASTNDNQASRDTAQFCVEKQMVVVPTTTKGGLKVFPAQPMQQTPATGSEALTLLGLIPAGLGGLFLRRKASK